MPFSDAVYEARLAKLRMQMATMGIDACVLTSKHNVAYYFGFLYCTFGRPCALVVTATDNCTFSAGIDAGQPWQGCFGAKITYIDWQRNNYWREIQPLSGTWTVIGFEGDHISHTQRGLLDVFLSPSAKKDIALIMMTLRMQKSTAEIEFIRAGAATADIGGYAIKEAIKAGAREIDIAIAGRNAMEL